MITSQHRGFTIRHSDLTQQAYRAAPCDVLLVVTRKNLKRAIAEFARADATTSGFYSGLRTEEVEDLSFLKDFPSLRYLEITGRKPVSLSPLIELSNLRGLMVENPGSGLDFKCFPELEVFQGTWHAHNCNLAAARELRRAHLWKHAAKDLAALAHITRLEELHLTQTSIHSLDGLQTLADLRYFDLAYAPKLKSLAAFAACNDGLREVSFQKVPGISSYQPISALRRLRRLKLGSCAPMPDLKWIEPLGWLDFFSFVDTNVVDGDLSPLLRLPCLAYVGTFDKKHYNLKSAALMETLANARALTVHETSAK